MRKFLIGLFLFLISIAFSCTKENDTPEAITLLNTTINGSALADGAQNVETTVTIELVFSATLSISAFEAAVSLRSASDTPDINLSYLSQTTRARITADLQPETTYTLQISDAAIGQDGQRLAGGFSRSFTTGDNGIITSLPPCTSAGDCLETVAITTNGTANFQFYASFPIYEEQARWEELTAAVVVIHGINRNADDYFNYMTQSLQGENLACQYAFDSALF
jgi:hypothetical protein